MDRIKTRYTQFYPEMITALSSRGLLLGSYDAEKKPNLMTIGWGSVGVMWGEPIWTVLVRPSRHTYHCIEHTGCFTVNVPGDDLSMACAVCGSKSGRQIDKFTECNLTVEQAANVLAPIVAECPLVYECQVVHRNDVLPEKLADEILTGTYVDGDYHRVYHGKILSCRAAENTADLLGG